MRPEIEAYIREHGDRYTPEALRRALLEAGYEPTEVDAALRELASRRAASAGNGGRRSRFWLVAIALHLAALVVAGIWIANSASATYFGFVVTVLVVVLLIGLGISGLIGYRLLPRSGLAVALVVPLVSALLLGGTCMALSGPLVIPPRTGTMQLHVTGARSFDGSGAAVCHHAAGGGYGVSAENLGTVEGNPVSASLDAFQSKGVPSDALAGSGVNLGISFGPGSDIEKPEAYGMIFSTQQTVEASADGFTGRVDFEGLVREGGQASEQISGTLSWTCR
jgi:hypothetical protein